jgi:DNA-binding transcriptional ArsR family regulator
MSVGEIVGEFGLAQSTVSHHLKILGEVGFALVDRQVTSSWWRVNEQCLASRTGASSVTTPERNVHRTRARSTDRRVISKAPSSGLPFGGSDRKSEPPPTL